MSDDTVKLGYSSHANISFRGEIDTGISREEWADMTGPDKDEVFNDLIWELVDLYEIDE